VFENVSLYAWFYAFHIMFRGRNYNFSNRKYYLKVSRKECNSIDCLYPLKSYYYINITCYKSNNNLCFAVVAFWVGTLLCCSIRRYEHLEGVHIQMPETGLGRNFTDDFVVIFSTSGEMSGRNVYWPTASSLQMLLIHLASIMPMVPYIYIYIYIYI